MPVGDIYRLTISGHQGTDVRLNSLAVRQLGEDPATDAEITTFANEFKDQFRNQQHSTSIWDTWEYRQLWGPDMITVPAECRREGGIVRAGDLTGFGAGDISTGTPLPHQSAMVVTLVSGFAGRRRRGRWYGWGFADNQQQNSLWVPTTISAMETRLAAFLAEYGDDGTDPNFEVGIWSERIASGCKPNPITHKLENVDTPHPELAFTSLQNLIVRPRVFSQRRRVPGVGF